MRLIDADSLKSAVDSRVYHNHNGIIKIIDEQPTINTVSSAHAHWIREFLTQTGCYECSSSGRYSTLETNYCGSCGAKMDEDYDTYIFNEELSKECSLSQQTVSEKKCLYTRTHQRSIWVIFIRMKAYENEAASSTNPSTWSDFDTALESWKNSYYDYCGFVFADNGYVGIDIDGGFDEDGFLNATAVDIVGRCKSYTEKSRSGRGFHILLRGTLPFKGKNNLKGVEIYKEARYFILTGNTLLYGNIIENQEAIDYVVEKYFPESRETKSNSERDRIYHPVWQEPIVDGRIKLRPVYPRIPNGSRNICLTSLAGLLHNQGYSKLQIYDELLYANDTACDPPLEKYELRTICNSVTRYKR